MADTLLTVDIGNSRIKAALWQDRELLRNIVTDYDKDSVQLEGQLQSLSGHEALQQYPPSKILVACVAGEVIEHMFSDCFQRAGQIPPEFFRTTSSCCGLKHAYAVPEQHGVDRWAALIGARKLYEGALCVVDVGTAVTVDLLTAENQHRGGRIMPGLNMMRHSLSSSTAGIHTVEGNVIQFAANTADAVTSGTLSMLIAAVEQAVREASKDFGDTMVTVFTGGQAQIVISEMDIDVEYHHEPDLVLHGLQSVSEQG